MSVFLISEIDVFAYGFVTCNLSLTSSIVMHNRCYLNVAANVVTTHLLYTLFLVTGLVCITAEQIESASQTEAQHLSNPTCNTGLCSIAFA